MSVSDGQSVNAAITNAALMSRLNNTSTIGRVDVNNTTDSTLPTNGALHTTGGLGVEKSANVGENLNVVGNLDVDGSSTLNTVSAASVTATGLIQANDLTATDELTANSANITTNANVGANLDVNGTADVAGNTSLSTVSTSGLATLNSASVTNNATVGGTLGVTGNTSLSTVSTTGLASLQSAQTTAGLTVGTNLQVNGSATVTGNLTVNGTLTSVNSATLEVTDQNILVNNNGNDATSEGAGLTVERTGTSGSLIYKAASATKWAAGNLGSEVDLVDVSTAQTLTNKTINGLNNTITNVTATNVSGTVAIANGGTGQTTAVAAFDALAPTTTKGDLIVHNGTDNVRVAVGTNNQVLVADSAEAAGVKWTTANFGGGGGGVNLIENGDYESGIQIWTAYNDSSTTRPVDGIGGTPTVPAAGFIITNTIRGNGSFALSKDAANRQGQGWAVSNIQIPQEFRGKSLKFYMAYKFLTNGDFTAGSNNGTPTDGDAIVYFYDQTNNKLVEPSNIKFFSNGTLVDAQESSVQFDVTCSQVRLIVHIASTSTTAWQMILDSIRLGPNEAIYGTPDTDWQSYTPTFSNLGTPTSVDVQWRRRGPNLEISGRWTNGTVGAGTATFTIPPVGSVNLVNTRVLGVYGHQGSATGELLVWGGSNLIQFGGENWQVPMTGTQMATGAFTTVQLSVPIVGWTGSNRMSEAYDGRPYFVCANLTAGQSIPNATATKLNLNNQTQDYHGSYDPINNRYRIFKAEDLKISGLISWDPTTAYVPETSVVLYVNGANANRAQANHKPASAQISQHMTPFEFTYPFKAGDYWEIYVFQTSGTNFIVRGNNTAGQITNVIVESASSGSQAIAASGEVSFSVSSTNGPSYTALSLQNLPFNLKNWDTHNIYNTTTGQFRMPRAGRGRINARVLTASLNPGGNVFGQMNVLKNGSDYKVISGSWQPNAGNTTYLFGEGGCLIEGTSSDVFSVSIYFTQNTNVYAAGDAARQNYLDFSME